MRYVSVLLIGMFVMLPAGGSERDTPFAQEVRTEFGKADGLPAEQVNDVCRGPRGVAMAGRCAGGLR